MSYPIINKCKYEPDYKSQTLIIYQRIWGYKIHERNFNNFIYIKIFQNMLWVVDLVNDFKIKMS